MFQNLVFVFVFRRTGVCFSSDKRRDTISLAGSGRYAQSVIEISLTSHTGVVSCCWHSARNRAYLPRLPLLRDGDLIPCSMTIALLASSRIE